MDRELTYGFIFTLFCLLSVVIADVCDPNPCQYEGKCSVDKKTGNATCSCWAPSHGDRCEIGGEGIKRMWLTSLAFSIPICLLLILAVILLYGKRIQKRNKENELEIDYESDPNAATSPKGSPLDMATTSTTPTTKPYDSYKDNPGFDNTQL